MIFNIQYINKLLLNIKNSFLREMELQKRGRFNSIRSRSRGEFQSPPPKKWHRASIPTLPKNENNVSLPPKEDFTINSLFR